MNALLALLLAASVQAAEPSRVLFVGNSLTYVNDVPGMVARIAAADGRKMVTRTVAFPDFGLEDHLHDGRARAALQRGRWDVVVLQQGPSSLDESRALLVRDTRAFAEIAPSSSTTIALLMVWPAARRAGDFPRVEESYRLAAAAVSGTFVPTGVNWLRVLARDRELALYGADGFHPTAAGSWLSALTLYRTLSGPLPVSLRTRRGAEKAAAHRLDATDAQIALLYDVANGPGTIAR